MNYDNDVRVAQAIFSEPKAVETLNKQLDKEISKKQIQLKVLKGANKAKYYGKTISNVYDRVMKRRLSNKRIVKPNERIVVRIPLEYKRSFFFK